MKYVLIAPFWIVLVMLSMMLGSIMYLWRFSEKDFFLGTTFINSKVIKFSDWFFFK